MTSRQEKRRVLYWRAIVFFIKLAATIAVLAGFWVFLLFT